MKLAPALVLAAGLAAPTVASTPASADACHVAAYLPGWVGWVISAELPEHDVVALQPAGYVFTDKPVIPTGQATLVRSSRIVGQTVFTDDPEGGTSSFVVDDAAGKKLFELRLDLSVCRLPGHAAGVCRTVTARTALEPTLPAAGGEPLQMQLGPDDTEFPLYYRYGTVVDFAAFHQAFGDMVNWLEATLARTTVATTPALSTPQAAAYWALASRPDVAPYLGGLRFGPVAGATASVAVAGRVPTAALVDEIRTALAGAGYASPSLDLTVDPSVAVPRLNQDLLLPCAIN